MQRFKLIKFSFSRYIFVLIKEIFSDVATFEVLNLFKFGVTLLLSILTFL